MRWTRQRRARQWQLQGGSLWISVSDAPARRRTRLKRTAKPCGPGTRCWCQVCGGASAQPGADVSLIRRWRWQDEFVAEESAL